MDAAAGFRFRDPLHPMHSAFVFKPPVGIIAADRNDDLLESAEFGGAGAEDFFFPLFVLDILHVHAVKVAGKEGRLFSPGSGPDLQNGVFFILGIPGQQQLFDPAFQLGQERFVFIEFFPSQFPQFIVRGAGQKFPVIGDLLQRLPVANGFPADLGETAVLPGKFRQPVVIRDDGLILQKPFHLFLLLLYRFELIKQKLRCAFSRHYCFSETISTWDGTGRSRELRRATRATSS